MYADYSYYSTNYHGSLIPQAEYGYYGEKSSAKLDFFTFGRIGSGSVTDQIRSAACEVAEVMYQADKRRVNGAEVTSENNDGYSVSYAHTSGADPKRAADKDLYDAAYTYLAQTGLMDWSLT